MDGMCLDTLNDFIKHVKIISSVYSFVTTDELEMQHQGVDMGLTKPTLCGIILFKLNTFLVTFLQVPSIDSTCFLRM